MTESDVNDITSYAAAVRVALSEVPPEEREELLEDLENHLSEVAAESGAPLTQRLGSPEDYARELRAAYGTSAQGSWRAGAWQIRVADAWSWIVSQPIYRPVRSFLLDLRPGWWVLRGYLAVMLLWNMLVGAPVGLVSDPFRLRNILWLIAVPTVIWGSVYLGRRSRAFPRGWSGVVAAVNVVVALLVLPGVAELSTQVPYYGPPQNGNVGTVAAPQNKDSFEVAVALGNIFPYSQDHKPLNDVLLYDQDGRAIVLTPLSGETEPNYPMGADRRLIKNIYPLPQAASAPKVSLMPSAPAKASPAHHAETLPDSNLANNSENSTSREERLGQSYGITNIFAYSKEGKNLEGVRLYDQDGEAIVLDNRSVTSGEISYRTGPDGLPIKNFYPLLQQDAPPRVAFPPFLAPTLETSPTK